MARATRRQGGGQQRRRRSSRVRPAQLEQLNLNAAGIDVGATEHWVVVPPDRDAQPVQRFGAFTADLYVLAEWLRQCQIDTVVMESTGVYWIALFEVLEERGFDVKLVEAHQAHQVPGRGPDQGTQDTCGKKFPLTTPLSVGTIKLTLMSQDPPTGAVPLWRSVVTYAG